MTSEVGVGTAVLPTTAQPCCAGCGPAAGRVGERLRWVLGEPALGILEGGDSGKRGEAGSGGTLPQPFSTVARCQRLWG